MTEIAHISHGSGAKLYCGKPLTGLLLLGERGKWAGRTIMSEPMAKGALPEQVGLEVVRNFVICSDCEVELANVSRLTGLPPRALRVLAERGL